MHWDSGPGSRHVYVGAVTLAIGERVYLQNDSTDDDSPGFLLAAGESGLPREDVDRAFLAAHIASNGAEFGEGLMGGWPSSLRFADFAEPGFLVDAFISAVEHVTFTDDKLIGAGWNDDMSPREKREMMAEFLGLSVSGAEDAEPVGE